MSQWIINHIFSVLFIIAYYVDGSELYVVLAPELYLMLRANGPLGDAVAVSLE